MTQSSLGMSSGLDLREASAVLRGVTGGCCRGPLTEASALAHARPGLTQHRLRSGREHVWRSAVVADEPLAYFAGDTASA